MNVWAKVMFGFGAVFLLIGGWMTVSGGMGVGDATDWDPVEESVWSAQSGIYLHEIDDEGLLIFVSDDVRCDEFELTITIDGVEDSSRGKYAADECTEDGALPWGHEDDPDGWLHMGAIYNLERGVEYEIEANAEILAIPESVVWEIIGGFFGGLGEIFGGASCLCCGFIFLLIGLIVALTVKDPKPATTLNVQPVGDLPDEGTKPLEKTWYEE